MAASVLSPKLLASYNRVSCNNNSKMSRTVVEPSKQRAAAFAMQITRRDRAPREFNLLSPRNITEVSV